MDKESNTKCSKPQMTSTWRLFVVSMLISFGGSFHYGYSLTVLNPTEWVFRQFINSSYSSHYGHTLTDTQFRFIWSIILNLQLIGATVGTFPLVKLSETLGRKKTLYICAAFTLSGLITQTLAKFVFSFELLAIGRFLIGMGNGLSLGIEPMFLNEVSPVEKRGLFCSMTGVFIELGFIIGGVAALPAVFGTDSLWPLMFAAEIPSVVLVCLALPFLHESPRFLVSRGHSSQAHASCAFYGHKDIEATLQEMDADIKCQTEQVTLKEVYQKVYLRRAAFLGTLVSLTAAVSGMIAIDYFSTHIFMDVGLSRTVSEYASVGVFVHCFVSAIVGGLIVDKVGRRILLLVTTGLFVVIDTALMILSIIYRAYGVQWAGYTSVAACAIFAFNFGVGPSVLQWTVPSELVPHNARSSVQTIAMTLSRLACIAVGTAFYPLQGAIEAYSFLIFIIPLVLFFIIFVFQFPETKKKTTVEILQALGYEGEAETSCTGPRMCPRVSVISLRTM